MTARIYTGVEAMVLREAATPGPWFVDEWDETDDDGSQHGLMIVGSNRDRGRPVFFDEGGVDADDMALAAAAPDLAASVCYHAAETRREQGRVSGLMLLLDDEKTKRVAAEQECATLRARVATLESLATGPRLTIDAAACDAIDGGATAGPQHVDATGREVLP